MGHLDRKEESDTRTKCKTKVVHRRPLRLVIRYKNNKFLQCAEGFKFEFGGMTTIADVAKMENWGEDISDFVIPKAEDTNEVPLPDSAITIGYFKQM